jgi:hypothetical protein
MFVHGSGANDEARIWTRGGLFWPCAAFVIAASIPGCDYGDPVISMPPSAGIDVDAVENPALYLAALVNQGAILRADVNGDGVVDIVDLVIVAQSFGEVSTDVTSLVTVLDESVRWIPGRGPDDDPNAQAWEFSYLLTLRNETRETRSARVVWRWFDAAGFLIDEVPVNIALGGGEERTASGILTVRNFGPDGSHTAEVVSATVPGIGIHPPPPPG